MVKKPKFGGIHIEVSQVFETMHKFWCKMQDYAIQDGFAIDRRKNESVKFTTQCIRLAVFGEFTHRYWLTKFYLWLKESRNRTYVVASLGILKLQVHGLLKTNVYYY